MVDNYFGQHQNDSEFTEPYDDASFIAKVYREKNSMMQTFISSIVLHNENKFSKSNKINRILSYYKSELEATIEKDEDILEKWTSKAGGYSYKKAK